MQSPGLPPLYGLWLLKWNYTALLELNETFGQGDAFTLTMCLVPFSLVAGRDWLQGTGHGEGNPGRDPPNIRAGRANISRASHLDHSTCRSTGYRIGRATPLGPTGRR